VICICGKIIKLNRHWEEDYLNRHVKSSSCKAKENQRIMYNFFKLISKKIEQEDAESSDEEYNSDFYENLDDDDLLQVDEINSKDETPNLSTDDENITQHSLSKKRQTCVGLQSAQISLYVK
jgi:hypothetical protein